MNASKTLLRGSQRIALQGILGLVLLAGSAQLPAQETGAAGTEDSLLRRVGDEARPCLNVRLRPTYRARVGGCLAIGSLVSVGEVRGAWSLVTGGDITGWAGSRFLVALDAGAEGPEGAPTETVQEPVEPSPVKIAIVTDTAAADAPATAADAPIAATEPPVEETENAPAEIVAETMEAPPGNAGAPIEAPMAAPEPMLEAQPEPVAEPLEVRLTELDLATARAESAEARATGLETELQAVRGAWQSSAEATGKLTARVEELTAERDSLKTQLARADARVLYLLADLERTRGELMRLKGIPAKLVEPEPEPEPEPILLPPEPELELAPSPEEETFALPVGGDVASMDEAVATVRAWAQAWSQQQPDGYLSFYSSAFAPANGESRPSWEARRRERILAPASIQVTLDQINPIVIGDRSRVMFLQTYTSDTFTDVVQKTLVLTREDGGWKILEEIAE